MATSTDMNESALINAAKNVIGLLETENIKYTLYPNPTTPSSIIIRKEDAHSHRVIGDFCFEKINLPVWQLSPEMIKAISKNIFNRALDNEVVLRQEYKSCRYLAPASTPFLDQRLCIPLTDDLIDCCKKSSLSPIVLAWNKYFPLGNSAYETLEQQIENSIVTGRADRIVSPSGCTGPCPEHTGEIILKENKLSIKTSRVLIGSFPMNGPVKRIDPNKRWIRVVTD